MFKKLVCLILLVSFSNTHCLLKELSVSALIGVALSAVNVPLTYALQSECCKSGITTLCEKATNFTNTNNSLLMGYSLAAALFLAARKVIKRAPYN